MYRGTGVQCRVLWGQCCQKEIVVEGENVASDGVLVFSSVCGEQRVYGRDVVRVICNLWRSGVYVAEFKKVFHNIVDVFL